jgi:hypothetical protein
LRAISIELLGVLAALALALIALAHMASSGRSWILFYDGDSELLPLIAHTIRAGQPLHWAMSTTLFIPEIALYLICAVVTSTVHEAIALNAVVNQFVFFLIIRGVAGFVGSGWSRRRRVVLSVVGQAVFTGFVLLESSPSNNIFELFSLNLTGTYYWFIVVSTGLVALLVARLLGNGARPSARSRWLMVGAIGIITLIAVISSPIYIAWVLAPTAVVVALLLVLRRIRLQESVLIAVTLLVGCVVGWVARAPFKNYISIDPVSYVHLWQFRLSLGSYKVAVLSTAETGLGTVVLVGMVAVVVISLIAAILAYRRGVRDGALYLPTIAGLTALVLCIGAVVTGQNAPRYLLPGVMLPIFLFPAVLAEIAHLPRIARLRLARPLSSSTARTLGIMSVLVLAASLVVVPVVTFRAVSNSTFSQAKCLEKWVDGRNLTGVGSYWTVRTFDVYGDKSVHLLQVQIPSLTAYAWMIDLDSYRVPDVSYVMVTNSDPSGSEVTSLLGSPAHEVSCSGYQIYDYAGTPGEQKLTSIVTSSGAAERAARGW